MTRPGFRPTSSLILSADDDGEHVSTVTGSASPLVPGLSATYDRERHRWHVTHLSGMWVVAYATKAQAETALLCLKGPDWTRTPAAVCEDTECMDAVRLAQRLPGWLE